MQERQLDMFASAERRTEELLLRLEMEQRKADQEASLRTRDRELLFKIVELFSKKYQPMYLWIYKIILYFFVHQNTTRTNITPMVLLFLIKTKLLL